MAHEDSAGQSRTGNGGTEVVETLMREEDDLGYVRRYRPTGPDKKETKFLGIGAVVVYIRHDVEHEPTRVDNGPSELIRVECTVRDEYRTDFLGADKHLRVAVDAGRMIVAVVQMTAPRGTEDLA